MHLHTSGNVCTFVPPPGAHAPTGTPRTEKQRPVPLVALVPLPASSFQFDCVPRVGSCSIHRSYATHPCRSGGVLLGGGDERPRRLAPRRAAMLRSGPLPH